MQQNQGLDRQVMHFLRDMLTAHHQYVPVYEHAFEILQDYNTNNDVGVRLPGLDCRRYEVAVILPGKNYRAP